MAEKIYLKIENRGLRPKEDPVGSFLDKFKPFEASEKPFDLSYLSPEQKAETMWALLREAVQVKQDNNRQKFNRILNTISYLYNDDIVRGVYLKAYGRHLLEAESVNGDYENYQILQRRIKELESILDSTVRELFGKRAEGISEFDQLIFKTTERELLKARKELTVLLGQNSSIAAIAQYETFKKYAKQFQDQGYIWTSSRRDILEEMEVAALSGDPLLLLGESGSGKTVIFKQAALTLTGILPARTPGKNARFDKLVAEKTFAKKGDSEVVYYDFKEIGEAATGKKSTLDEKPSHDGRWVLDDEFLNLDPAEQKDRVKGVVGFKPGQRVMMPVTNTEEYILPKFLYGATGNPPSVKYSTSKEIPPEVLREFKPIDISYLDQTPDNPEIYETMITVLMAGDDRFRAAKEEVAPEYEFEEGTDEVEKNGQKLKRNIKIRRFKEVRESGGRTIPAGGFLWRFANALNQLNKSFSHQETVWKSRGDAQYIKKLIIGIGVVLNWLKEYKMVGQDQSLENFIVKKINDEFLSQSSFSQDDRKLISDFLGYYGIKTDKLTEKSVKFEILTPRDIGLLSPRVKYREVINEEPQITDSFYIDNNGQRIEYTIKESTGLMPGHLVEHQGKVYRFVGVRKDNGEGLFLPFIPASEKRQRKSASERESTLISQSEQLNRDFFQDKYDSLFLESIPNPQFSEQVWSYIEKKELHAYYLPEIKFPDITKDTDIPQYVKTLETTYPNWLLPQQWFFDRIKEYVTPNEQGITGIQGIPPSSLTLKGGWRFIETVQKPNYQQKYPITELMTNIATLMEKDDIHYTTGSGQNQTKVSIGQKLSQGDRFSLTHSEVSGNEVDGKGKTIGKHTNQGITDYATQVLNNPTRLATEWEWNLMSNLQVFQEIHQKPQPNQGQGQTNTWEWLEDERLFSDGGVVRLVAGSSDVVGLQSVGSVRPSGRYVSIGFRLLGSE